MMKITLKEKQRTVSTRSRPLSPHLSIYSSQYSSRLSISHRVSGSSVAFVFLCSCFFVIKGLLYRTLFGFITKTSRYAGVVSVLPHFLNGVMLCRLLSFIYHRLNGCRHLVWDNGKLLDKATRDRSSVSIRMLTMLLTSVVFFGWRNGGLW